MLRAARIMLGACVMRSLYCGKLSIEKENYASQLTARNRVRICRSRSSNMAVRSLTSKASKLPKVAINA